MESETRSIWSWLGEIAAGWPVLVGVVVLCLVAAFVATTQQPTLYRAEGSVVVSPQRFLEAEGTDALPALTENVVRLTTTPAVLIPSARFYVGLGRTPADKVERRQRATLGWMRDHLRVREIGQSSVIEISGTGPTQAAAMDLTRGTVASLTNFVTATRGGSSESGDGEGNSDGLIVLSTAEAKGQVSPTALRNFAVALNAGLLLGGVLALAAGRRQLEVSERREHRSKVTA